jgi:hypothetical protein
MTEEKIGEFFTDRGFHYRGKLLDESPTHWKIFDFKTRLEMEISKTSVSTVSWQTKEVI